jgi:hypothetical protein
MPNQIRDIYWKDDVSFPYIFEQNVSIELKDGKGIVRANVYRPKDHAAACHPVLVTYGPYGKDIHYSKYGMTTLRILTTGFADVIQKLPQFILPGSERGASFSTFSVGNPRPWILDSQWLCRA